MDELDFDLFFKEISDSIGDSEKLVAYITDRSAVMVERFLVRHRQCRFTVCIIIVYHFAFVAYSYFCVFLHKDYLPRMSIPIERRELPDGWVLTCRSKEGGDLRLSDISVERENLLCQVVGSDNVFKPIRGKDNTIISTSLTNLPSTAVGNEWADNEDDEDSVLEQVRELILSAQKHGAWVAGVAGLREVRKTSLLSRLSF